MSEILRPRPRRGVLGHVAELQQFDPVPASAGIVAGPEPAVALPPAPPPPPAPPAPAPVPVRTPTVTFVSHIRQQSRRWIRTVLIGGAAVVILTGAGLGYAALGEPADGRRAQAPGTAPAGGPAGGALPLDPALPGAAPITGRPSVPAPTGTPATTSTAAAGAIGTGQPPAGPGLPVLPVLPGRPDPLYPAPVATAVPTEPADPATTPPPATTRPPAPPRPLVATLSHVADPVEGGFLGYAGTVRIDNPRRRDAARWQVTLTVPGGNIVTATGVTVVQDGETVTFRPGGNATVPAGGAVTFSFEVAGVLTALPGGCAIGGAPCS